MLVVLTQVDNYIYTGEKDAMKGFENYLSSRFQVGEKLRQNYTVYGTEISTDEHGVITLSQEKQLSNMVQYPIQPSRAALSEEPANDVEKTAYLSIIGSMLFIGSITNPSMLSFASHAARNIKNLRVHHVNELNKMIAYYKRQHPVVKFRRPSVTNGATIVFCDASHGRKEETHPHIGYITFNLLGNIAHPISYASHKAKRVARSTLAAESLAAADAFDCAYFMRAVNPCHKWTITLITDSTSLAALTTTTHDPREKRVKLDICALREAFENKELAKVLWISSRWQLADSLTKCSSVNDDLLKVLQTGYFPAEIHATLKN